MAFGAEIAITFVLMLVVLAVSNSRRPALTGLCAGALVATYIALEAPVSGMSMNPARTLASAVPAGTCAALWIYFTAPLIGMLLAADVYLALARGRGAICAKVYHHPGARCIFRCGYAERARAEVSAPRARSSAVIASGGCWPERARGARGAGPVARDTLSGVGRGTRRHRGGDRADRVGHGPVGGVLRGRAGLRDGRGRGGVGSGLRAAHRRVRAARAGGDHAARRRADRLTEYLTPRGRAAPTDSRSNDAWFQHVAIITNDIEQAYLWLRRHKVQHVSTGPQAAAGLEPEGGRDRRLLLPDTGRHPLEILEFTARQGRRALAPAERAHLPRDRSHRDRGRRHRAQPPRLSGHARLRVAGAGENWGPEQERLNQVFGARLRITTLRADAGPGIELLEYLTPRTGRPAPVDAAANDLAHWHNSGSPASRPPRPPGCAPGAPTSSRRAWCRCPIARWGSGRGSWRATPTDTRCA